MTTLRQAMIHVLAPIAFVSVLLVVACGEEDAAVSGPSGAGAVASPMSIVQATEAAQATVIVAAPANTSEPPPVMSTQGWEGATIGLPAIVPSLLVVPGQPAFTEQDVRDYIANNPPSYTDTNEAIVVKRVEFLPVEEVEMRINHAVSVPRGTLLCLVTIQGKWTPPPFVVAVETQNPKSVLYQIYDAQTGNYLAETSGIETN